MQSIAQHFVLFALILSSSVYAQQCSNGDFIVTNGQEMLLKITAANEVFTCDRVNICEKINNGLQSLSLGSDGALSISNGNSIALPDSSATNEIQTLTITSGVLAISGGNSVELPDSSATNEIQRLSLNNNAELSISGTDSVIQLPDASARNEIQTLALNGNVLSIVNGNNVVLPDASATNELQSLAIDGGLLLLSSANSVQLPDNSSTNELQLLALANGQLTISRGNTVSLPDDSPTNELQSISIQQSQLSLSNSGGAVELSSLKTYLKFLGLSVSVPVYTLKTAATTLIPFNRTDWTTFPASSFDNSTSTFYPPLAGFYRFSLRGFIPTVTSGADTRVSIYWKVSNYPGAYSGMCGGQLSNGDSPMPTCSYIAKLGSTDNVQAMMYTPIDVKLGSSLGTEFQWQIEFLGPE